MRTAHTGNSTRPGRHAGAALSPAGCVRDAMLTVPKTYGPDLTVHQARSALLDEHVHMLLITDRGRLLSAIVREDLSRGDRAAPAMTVGSNVGRTIAPTCSLETARRVMLARHARRLAVVDDDGRLLGLLCLKRHLGGFCSDADVAARASAPRR